MEDDDYEYSIHDSDEEGSQKDLSNDYGIGQDIDSIPLSSDSRAAPEVTDRQVLGTEELLTEMNKSISEVREVIGVSTGVCRILLHQFKWNKESLLERFFEAQDTDHFLRLYHVLPKEVALAPPSNTGDCDICFSNTVLSGLRCNHLACLPCWERYLEVKIGTDSCPQIECIGSNCHLLVDDETVLKYIHAKNIRETFKRLTTNSFVESNRFFKWCLAPDCGKAIKVYHCEARPVLCSCGFRWCFGCSEAWHEPVNCRLLKLWTKKCSDDSETSNWINVNTKECPKCQVTIEKNGGCNHMTCRNLACRMEFCWLCLGVWQTHGGYSCNRFDESSVKEAMDAQERSRIALERYLHYYNRYMNHQQSLRLESKLYATLRTKMDQMQKRGMSWIEVQFLPQSVDVLSDCRRTLMYTYVFAFYLVKDDNQSIIFEDNQRDLEMATEQLSGFLEGHLEAQDLETLKQKVQDKCRYVEHRRQVLLRHCEDGTEKETWKYTD